MKSYRWLFALLLVFGCTIASPSSAPPASVSAGERLVSESFDTVGRWSNYTTDTVIASVTDGVYRLLLREPAQYIWGSNGQVFDDSIIEVDVMWQSDNPRAFAGVVCRLHPDNGRGYYVVVSADGDFSIRYLGRNIDDAIVRWQAHSRIPTSGRFRLRVTCIEDTIALSIDGHYIDSGTDSRLKDGQVGLAVGMPQTVSPGAIAFADFDNLRVWQATQE